jgi:meso-butanediol dehydrogenase / (S,S)-butanediol dehydrogenase / diacetyl reductase
MSDRKISVVTGAGSGIGLAITKRLATDGDIVVAVDIKSVDEVGAVLSELEQQHHCVPYCADIADPDMVDALFQMIDDKFGRVDSLVNNAGVVRRGGLDEMALADIDLVIATNLRGTILCSRAALPLLRRSGAPAVVNIASELGVVGALGLSVYCAAKGGIVQLTKAMAADHASDGIRVNCVCPGPVLTPLIQERIDASDDADALYRHYAEATLMKRIGLPDEIASVVRFVASSEASFMTGSILLVDGGATAV